MWRSRKITEKVARADITRSRDNRADATLRALDSLCQKEAELDEQETIMGVQIQLRQQQHPFVTHPEVQSWVRSFSAEHFGIRSRWPCLGLVGDSQTGNTCLGMSLWPGRTLKVSCNGLPNGIMPSLKGFSRQEHSAILFDEVRPDQILGNREVFQSGPHVCKLSQSACGQHEYSVWLYAIPLICCSNNLSVPSTGDTFQSDEEWFRKNVVLVELAPGQRWFVQPGAGVRAAGNRE